MGLLATTCLGALRGEQATATATPISKDVETPPLDSVVFPSCTAHAECKPMPAAGPNDPEMTPTFCVQSAEKEVGAGNCQPCSECHQGARATAAEPPRPSSSAPALRH